MCRESQQSLSAKRTEAQIMKSITFKTCSIFLLLFLPFASCFAAGVTDSTLGLSKTSINDSPKTEKYNYTENFPGTGKLLPRTYSGAPSQIPHSIESFIPVTTKNNMCKQCHDTPTMIGKNTKGMPTPIPTSHYIDVRHAPGKVSKQLVAARTACTQCHVPQAKTKPLVGNNYSNNAMGK